MGSPLVGAWEPVSDAMQGVWVCTETHYANVSMPASRVRSEGGDPTPEEAMEPIGMSMRSLARIQYLAPERSSRGQPISTQTGSGSISNSSSVLKGIC